MSKPFINKFKNTEKNIYTTNTIPDTFKDQIRKFATTGEYGKLEELFASNPVNISFYENDIETSLLHSIIQSDLTEQQKNMIVSSLIKRGISINILDGNNLPPIFYAIKFQLLTIVTLLIDKHANLNIKLPKGYDLFITSLIPSESKCPSQLFSIQDQAYFNKYYNQTSSLERDIKKIIFDIPYTSTFIKEFLEFCINLPNDGLDVDIEEEPKGSPVMALTVPVTNITKIYNTLIQDERIKSTLPSFNNYLNKSVNNISNRLNDEIKNGNISIDQLILKQPILIAELSKEMSNYLDVNKVKKYPDISFDNINNTDFDNLNDPDFDFDNMYITLKSKIFNFGENSDTTVVNRFIDFYNKRIEVEIDTINNYNLEFSKKFKKLRYTFDMLPYNNLKNDLVKLNRLYNLNDPNLDQMYFGFFDSIVLFLHYVNKINLLLIENRLRAEIIDIRNYYNHLIKYLNIGIIDYNNIIQMNEINKYKSLIVPHYDNLYNNLNIGIKTLIRDIDNSNRKIIPISETLNLNHIQYLAEKYHNRIFYTIIEESYTDLFNKIKETNPNVKDIILHKLLLNTINNAIISSFNEILEIVIYRASVNIINNVLFKTISKDNSNLLDELKSRLEKKITFSSGKNTDKYYLNENYSNSEPIDVILCLNNNNDLIINLKKKMQINLREYQDFLIKLGSIDLINNLNSFTNKKIQKQDIIRYINDHDKKFDDGINYLNKELDDNIVKNNLEFFKTPNKITFTSDNRRLTMDPNSIDDIHNDMIKDQKICNEYLTNKLSYYLKNEFILTLIPLIKEFLIILSDIPDNLLNMLPDIPNNLVNENQINIDLLENIIINIINYHLNINPLKTKDKKMSLSEIMDIFTTSFIFNFDDPEKKQNIVTIYNEKMKSRVFTYVTIISQYALNVYRNQLRYIFNSSRYEKLKNIV